MPTAVDTMLDRLARSPMAALAQWPLDRPVVMLHSGRFDHRWGRWTILAEPVSWHRAVDGSSDDPVHTLDRLMRELSRQSTAGNRHSRSQSPIDDCRIPIAEGGLIGCFSYELGRVIEPAARYLGSKASDEATKGRNSGRKGRWHGEESAEYRVPSTERPAENAEDGALETRNSELGTSFPSSLSPSVPQSLLRSELGTSCWPLFELAWCPGALIFDHVAQQWRVSGDVTTLIPLLKELTCDPHTLDPTTQPIIGNLTSAWTPDEYLDAVRTTIEYIRAGDIFQANITQQFSAPFRGSTRLLAAAAFDSAKPLYGAYLELPGGRALVSMSPELFLQVGTKERVENAERRHTRNSELGTRNCITTRPIKGTRPATTDPDELLNSVKDAAELHMIVDLMRNDLGRVCEYGSVRVPVPRAIESHPTVHHGVSEITGTLRDDVTIGEVLRATFPGGSVTGAPKIRAMQIIEELEPLPRGPYCGSIGCIGLDGRATLNIAIRTIMLRGERPTGRFDYLQGELRYGAGGGIVADSDPVAEYRESLDKTAVLQQVIDAVKGQDVETSEHRHFAET